MTNKTILKKAIEKAEVNGFTQDVWDGLKGNAERMGFDLGLYGVIFSHNFAKAFWGKERRCSCGNLLSGSANACDRNYELKNWEFKLQKLVLEKEPLKYLKKFL